MLFVRDLPQLFRYAVSIIGISALCGLGIVAVWLPVCTGMCGFPLAFGIWLGTIVAAYHVMHWGFG
jgi:hypothetical protein